MRFEVTESFWNDFNGIKAHQERFKSVARDVFSPACDQFAVDPTYVWPTTLRCHPMKGFNGDIWEMTWSFSGPSGRATFEWVDIELPDGSFELAVRWRRIGTHDIYKSP